MNALFINTKTEARIAVNIADAMGYEFTVDEFYRRYVMNAVAPLRTNEAMSALADAIADAVEANREGKAEARAKAAEFRRARQQANELLSGFGAEPDKVIAHASALGVPCGYAEAQLYNYDLEHCSTSGVAASMYASWLAQNG